MMKTINKIMLFMMLLMLAACENDTEKLIAVPNDEPLELIKPNLADITAVPQTFKGVIDDDIIPEKNQNQLASVEKKAVVPENKLETTTMFHKVKDQETFEEIAAMYKSTKSKLVELNGSGSTNPRKGYNVLLPRNFNNAGLATDVKLYTVLPKESYSVIGQKFKISTTALQKLNNKKDDRLNAGEQIYVPKN